MQNTLPTRNQPISYKASKWIFQYLLADAEEFARFDSLSSLRFVMTGLVFSEAAACLSFDAWLNLYRDALEGYRKIGQFDFPCFFATGDLSDLYAYTLTGGRTMTKPLFPVLQIRPNYFMVVNGEVKTRVFGKGAAFFGLEFAFPTLYVHPETGALEYVLREGTRPAARTFRALMQEARRFLEPMQFEIDGKPLSTPFRVSQQEKERWNERTRVT
ncbi:MAG: hypothetical protein A3F09_02225 [Chlamydiae bacterium RIFCSPHIGHO2_12_FULL_49_11]|nr:MAG: hypothetical protein A3F09_02225 [Chlamydiae bacterium RIFCSPHIGHO2_12_FULL_49_11]